MIDRDTIIKLAREAGITLEDEQTGEYSAFDQELERFAALVAAAEREACAKVCVASDLIDWPTTFEVAAVRKCAAAIRARSQQ